MPSAKEQTRMIKVNREDSEEEIEQSCFAFQFVNRLLLLLTSAISLMAWDSFYNFIMPPGTQAAWNFWRLVLFTAAMLVVLIIMGLWHNRHQKKLAAAAKIALDPTASENTHQEAMALLENAYGNLTSAMGYMIIQVWLNVYPIPEDFTLWYIALSFFGVVFVIAIVDIVNQFIPAGLCKDVYGIISSNLASQGTWVIVNLGVPVWRKWAGVSGTQPIDGGVPGQHFGPPIWLGILAYFVGVLYVFVSSFVASRCCAAKKKKNADGEDELGLVFCEKTEYMIKQASMYICSVLYWQHFGQDSRFSTEGWWWAIAYLCFAAIFIQLLQLALSMIPCPKSCNTAGKKLLADAVSLMTMSCGWVSGKMVTGVISAALKVSRTWWVVLGIFFQILALVIEEIRVHCLLAHVETDEE